MSSPHRNSSQGKGFGLGMLIGSLVGIATYYMYGTKEGHKLRHKIVQEFDQAKADIPQEIAQILAQQENNDQSTSAPFTNTEPEATPDQPGLLAKVSNSIKSITKSKTTDAPEETDQSDTTPRFFHKSGKKLQ